MLNFLEWDSVTFKVIAKLLHQNQMPIGNADGPQRTPGNNRLFQINALLTKGERTELDVFPAFKRGHHDRNFIGI